MTDGLHDAPLVLAHRGDHRRWIENTADALLDACRLPGVDGVEFDVRSSADGEPVLVHDDTLERAFGQPLVVGEESAATLARAGVPHLADMLALLPRDAFLDIEIKGAPSAAAFDAIFRARGASLHRAVISSFETSVIFEVRARMPDWPCWLNVAEANRWTFGAARAVGAVGVAAAWPSITARVVAEARADGLVLAAWPVRRRPTLRRLATLGIAAVIVEGAALEVDPSHQRPAITTGTTSATVPAEDRRE